MPSRWKESLKELQALIAALKQRDPARAHAMATIHVRKAAEVVMHSFAENAAAAELAPRPGRL